MHIVTEHKPSCDLTEIRLKAERGVLWTLLVDEATLKSQSSFVTFNQITSLLRGCTLTNEFKDEHVMYGYSLANFMVTKICRYGEICHEIDYQGFEFEFRGDTWVDITKGQLLRLIKDIGGVPVINSTEDTVVVCADSMLHTSSKFSCIVEGKMVSLKEQTTNVEIV
ncbi:hypothetical protein DPMN_004612 [Dreissena polymorpha]|uniref:Uncharacterized protein n=1 Tax=Dreissena polymorpha TaxID=45954 RepID=A0A9D4MR44_DREPO|nr:hypothetical protein DPMN_004612 [Dreissena polymorpha]